MLTALGNSEAGIRGIVEGDTEVPLGIDQRGDVCHGVQEIDTDLDSGGVSLWTGEYEFRESGEMLLAGFVTDDLSFRIVAPPANPWGKKTALSCVFPPTRTTALPARSLIWARRLRNGGLMCVLRVGKRHGPHKFSSESYPFFPTGTAKSVDTLHTNHMRRTNLVCNGQLDTEANKRATLLDAQILHAAAEKLDEELVWDGWRWNGGWSESGGIICGSTSECWGSTPCCCACAKRHLGVDRNGCIGLQT